jgi:DNA-binding PadR family transcriptional regulator
MFVTNIRNLEINILFFICDSLNSHSENGSAMIKDVFEDFSDIPRGQLRSAVKAMVDEGLITTSPSQACLSITEKGISRLQSSVACRINNFDHCQCGQAF